MRHFFALLTLLSAPLFGHLTEMTSDNLQEILASDHPVIVNVTLPGCTSCHQFSTLFEIVAEEFKDDFLFATLNSLKERSIAIDFQVKHVPTLLFIKNGAVIERQVGPLSYDEFKKLILRVFPKEVPDDVSDDGPGIDNDIDVDSGDEGEDENELSDFD